MLLKHCKFLEEYFNCHIISGVYNYTRKLCMRVLVGNLQIDKNLKKKPSNNRTCNGQKIPPPHGSSLAQFFSAVFAMHNFFHNCQSPLPKNNNDSSLSEKCVSSTCVHKKLNKYAYLPLHILVIFDPLFLYLCYLLKYLKRVNFIGSNSGSISFSLSTFSHVYMSQLPEQEVSVSLG